MDRGRVALWFLFAVLGLSVGVASAQNLLPNPGYWLEGTNNLGVWWCESGWKIGRERGPPKKPGDGRVTPVSVSAARGEYEPAQVVLRSEKDGELLLAKIGLLRDGRGDAADIQVRLDEVAYVHVERPTDESCLRGWYPDPLPPLRTPLALHAGQNQPLWMTFHVSRDASPGDYRGELELKTTLGAVHVPISIHVYGFALSEETHLKSALGLGTHEINRYHKLAKPEDKQSVYEKYLRNFAEHRISPYSFYEYFWLLQEAIEKVRAKQGENDLLKQAHALLEVPAEISQDLTHFTTDPRPMLEHRDRIARMIERLE